MGNYYEGALTIGLKKDIPEKLKSLLINMGKDIYNIEVPNEWKNSNIFKNPTLERLMIEFGFVLERNNKCYTVSYYDKEEDRKNYYPEDIEKITTGYYVELRLCFKGYQNTCEEFIEWIKPFADTKYNYLGRVHDEDGYMDKEFFLDETILKKEINKRRKICEGCDRFKETSLCDNYKYCSRAYKKGAVE